MNCNVGKADKFARILVALAAAGVAVFGGVDGWLRVVLYVVAAVMLLTALAGFCPLYRLLGVSSCPR